MHNTPLELPRRWTRRQALLHGGALCAAWGWRTPQGTWAEEKARSNHPRLRITDIEMHSIEVPYHDWAAYEMNHFYGPTRRTIIVVRTNSELVGLGEEDEPLAGHIIDQAVGTNPFDWMGTDISRGLGTAMYDLMGQAAGVPVYKLIGPKHRSWVPIAAWTVSTHPQRMANTVLKLASLGYTWMKYHLSPFENVIDQMEAMQHVAPDGFRIHHDFTMGGTDDHVFELLEAISRYRIAGCFEDPLPERDIQGYAELRAKCRLPIYYHHSPLGAGHETQFRAADGYIMGGPAVGSAIRHAGLFEMLDLPFSLQCVGGTITRAMTVHLHAAFKAATLHFNTDTETWSDDVTKERLEPINGWIRVPETPGLGVSLDPVALERLKKLRLPECPNWIIKTRFRSGATMYNLANTRDPLFMVRPDKRHQITLSYNGPVTTEWWDPDGTPEFRRMMERLEKEGMVLE